MSDPMWNAVPPGGWTIDEGDREWREYDLVRCEACGAVKSKEDAERIEGGGWLCMACAEEISEMNEGRIK